MPKWIQRNSIEDSTGSANEDKKIWNVTHSETIRHIWRVFLKIKIRWKNRLNISFDEEFNALPDYAILIEKIDLENVGKKQNKHGMLQIHREFHIFDEVFSRLKFIGKTSWIDHSMKNSMLYERLRF